MRSVDIFLTTTTSAMLVAVVGGLIGMAVQRLLGIWIKPKYFKE